MQTGIPETQFFARSRLPTQTVWSVQSFPKCSQVFTSMPWNALHPVTKKNEDKQIHDSKKCHCHPGTDGCRFPTAAKILTVKRPVHSRLVRSKPRVPRRWHFGGAYRTARWLKCVRFHAGLQNVINSKCHVQGGPLKPYQLKVGLKNSIYNC